MHYMLKNDDIEIGKTDITWLGVSLPKTLAVNRWIALIIEKQLFNMVFTYKTMSVSSLRISTFHPSTLIILSTWFPQMN